MWVLLLYLIYPFIEGVSTQRYFPYDEKENDKAYKQSQQQRQLERNVRAKKRECVALDTLGDKEGFKKASVKLKRETDKLKQFCKDTGRMYKGDRVYTPNFNRSVSGKVNGENRKIKALTNKKTGAIMKSDYSNFSSDKKLNKHIKDHINEYDGLTSTQYVEKATKLLKSKANENIQEFYSKDGFLFKYDIKNNDFAVGRADGYISTLFKPKDGIDYWKGEQLKYEDK